MKTIFLAAACVALCASARGATEMNPSQAKAYFASAVTVASGRLGGSEQTAAVLRNGSAPGSTARLEIWRKTERGFELAAAAPNAGCFDCSGPSRQSNPSRVAFGKDGLEVEYVGSGAGLGSWTWRTTWGWDAMTSSARIVAAQRVGQDADRVERHEMVDFIAGTRAERSRVEGLVESEPPCRPAIAKTPLFGELSPRALFDGSLIPECN
jgi:hypothetical protein